LGLSILGPLNTRHCAQYNHDHTHVIIRVELSYNIRETMNSSAYSHIEEEEFV